MTQIGAAYGQALYDLAADEKIADKVLQELLALNAGFSAEPDFLQLLASPALPKQERCDILGQSFGKKVHPYVLNFLQILTEKGYIRTFSQCVQAYENAYNQAHNILPVTAQSAGELTSEQKARLTEKLSAITGKTIALTCQVNPACLGGVRLDFDGKRVDDTVAHRLESIQTLLKNTVL